MSFPPDQSGGSVYELPSGEVASVFSTTPAHVRRNSYSGMRAAQRGSTAEQDGWTYLGKASKKLPQRGIAGTEQYEAEGGVDRWADSLTNREMYPRRGALPETHFSSPPRH